MKYFKFTEPYFALVKAKHIGEATGIYSEDVTDIEDDYSAREVCEYTALGAYFNAISKQEPTSTISSVLKDFHDPDNRLLLVSGDLI